MISLSELLQEMRKALSHVMIPALPSGQVPAIPNLNNFKMPIVLPGSQCEGSDKAIALNIDDTSGGVEITICTFLEFELEGEYSDGNFVDGVEEYIKLQIDSGYILKGALSTGIKITVASLTELPLIELDPITAQLYLQSDISGSASLGLFAATISGNALLDGQVSLGYCSSCNGTYLSDDYQQTSENSPFYFSRHVGYALEGGLELSAAGARGLSLDVAKIGIKDDDAFDEIPPSIQLPDIQSLRDSIKFSPQGAVGKSLDMIFYVDLKHS